LGLVQCPGADFAMTFLFPRVTRATSTLLESWEGW
jgi:hypothetical protein